MECNRKDNSVELRWCEMQKCRLNSNENVHKFQTMKISKTTKFPLQKTNKERKLIETQLLFELLEFNGEKVPLPFFLFLARNQYVIKSVSYSWNGIFLEV